MDLQQTDQDVWYISEDKRDFSCQEGSILCHWLDNFYFFANRDYKKRKCVNFDKVI